MTIASEIQRIKTNIANAYTACDNKGATMPVTQNSANLADCIDSISGGGGDSGGEYLIQVIDYDGTVLKQDHMDAGATFTLPSQPSHTGLVFQEWSSPVVITNNTVTVTNSDIIIGAVYTTASGLSEFDITLTTTTGLSVTLNMDGTKNWGDGTSDTNTTHTYTSAGDYTITCNGTVMKTSTSRNLFGASSSYSISITGITNNVPYLKRVRLANNITNIPGRAFASCYSLEYITIPKGITSIDSGNITRTFASSSIPILIIPSTVTSISSRTCECCLVLKNVIIPYGCTIAGDYAFNYTINLERIQLYDVAANAFMGMFQFCQGLKEVIMPLTTTATSLGNATGNTGLTFSGCSSLKKLYIPNSIKTITQNSFNCCTSIIEYDFSNHTAVPTLSNTNAFTGINPLCKIKVPASLESQWKAATNWARYAKYIIGV